MINVSLSSNFTNKQIEEEILNALVKYLAKIFQSSIVGIKSKIQKLCELLILQSPTYTNLINGELLGALGVPDVESRMNAIINVVKNSVQIAYQPIIRRGSDLTGGLTINILKSDFSDILNISSATYQTERGVSIEWLDWLLIQGDRIIVIGYDVHFDLNQTQKIKSRTGLALMKHGAGFRLDPRFSGTKESNFLTKAFQISNIEELITDIIKEEINSRIL